MPRPPRFYEHGYLVGQQIVEYPKFVYDADHPEGVKVQNEEEHDALLAAWEAAKPQPPESAEEEAAETVVGRWGRRKAKE